MSQELRECSSDLAKKLIELLGQESVITASKQLDLLSCDICSMGVRAALAFVPTDRETVPTAIRDEIVKPFATKCAASNQIGKIYPYYSSLNPDTAYFVHDLRAVLDPNGLMNPGALGLPEEQALIVGRYSFQLH